MKRTKSIGLAVAMALALTALIGIASASAAEFRAEEYPTSVTGKQSASAEQQITTNGQTVTKCKTATTTGTESKASTTLTLTPTFSGCLYAGISATVKANSCSYVFHNSAELENNKGTMDLSCSKEGDALEINVSSGACILRFPAQSARASVNYYNSFLFSRNRSVILSLSLSGLKYTESGFACPSTGTFENGTYTGESVITGRNNTVEKAVGVYLANEQKESPPYFSVGVLPASVNASLLGQNFSFSSPNDSIKTNCSKMNGAGSLTTYGHELSLAFSEWNGCYLATIQQNSCHFVLHAAWSEIVPEGNTIAEGPFDIVCEKAGDAIKFTQAGCEVSIPAQNGVNTVNYTDVGSGSTAAVNATINTSTLKFTETKAGGGSCPSPGEHTNGVMIAGLQLKAYFGNSQVELRVF